MKFRLLKRTAGAGLAAVMALSLTACVDQHPEENSRSDAASEETRIVATSNATLQICDKLGLDLVGICTTSGEVPERYQGLPEIGTAMAPDAEKITMLSPTNVIGPDTLRETIEPTYQAVGLPYTFIDLQSVQGMYDSIAMLGEKYGVQDAADALIDDYQSTMSTFKDAIAGKDQPTVLVLMGLPGSYIECTPNSYVGSLVELAGAVNVVQVDDEMNFVSWNTEELLALDPDYILLTAHGLPEQAMEMFAEEFTTNDIWQHFRAVQENHVYQLDDKVFGMSCTFDWSNALQVLQEILYDGTYQSYAPETESHENAA